MSALTSPLLLAALLASHFATGSAQDAETVDAGQEAPAEAADESAEDADEAARAALKEAPRRSKIGKIRGVKATSEVRFAATPDDPYQLVASFGIPDRARVVLSNQNGSFGRFQLGAKVFGRDVQAGNEAASYVLAGAAVRETLIDIELRRALFLWPDDPRFVGAGRTYTTKVGDFGVLMATVDEDTGLPSKIESFGREGGAGAAFEAIEWEARGENGRARPTSLTFAAGGQAIWTETIQEVKTDWRFADTWFLPADRLTAVMGSKVADKMHVRALDGAWILTERATVLDDYGMRPRFREFKTDEPPADLPPIDWPSTTHAAAARWNDVRKRPELTAGSKSGQVLSPYVSLVLDPRGEITGVEYELMGATQADQLRDGLEDSDWKWRSPENIWAHPLATPKKGAPLEGFAEASKALAATYPTAAKDRPIQKLRFRVGEERLGGKVRVIGVDFVLTVQVPQPAEASAEKTGGEKR